MKKNILSLPALLRAACSCQFRTLVKSKTHVLLQPEVKSN